jgi:REP element-mobilizing transposase RayT
MPDHIHVVTDSSLSPARTLQFINGITGRRLIDHLKANKYEASLNKLRHEIRPRHYGYSLWNHHPDARLLLIEHMLMQRVHYSHQNPVRADFVKHPEEYRWSSIRCWSGTTLDDEPLLMDIDRIRWRRSGGIASLNILKACLPVSRRLTAMCCGKAAILILDGVPLSYQTHYSVLRSVTQTLPHVDALVATRP